jgi:hypothetical protein
MVRASRLCTLAGQRGASDPFLVVIVILLYLKVALGANNTPTASKSRGVLVVDGYPSMGW